MKVGHTEPFDVSLIPSSIKYILLRMSIHGALNESVLSNLKHSIISYGLEDINRLDMTLPIETFNSVHGILLLVDSDPKHPRVVKDLFSWIKVIMNWTRQHNHVCRVSSSPIPSFLLFSLLHKDRQSKSATLPVPTSWDSTESLILRTRLCNHFISLLIWIAQERPLHLPSLVLSQERTLLSTMNSRSERQVSTLLVFFLFLRHLYLIIPMFHPKITR